MDDLRSEDGALVKRMLAGDERAFEEFFERYFPGLYRFALIRLGDEDAAEEVAQASLSKAVQKLATFRGEATLFTWLRTFCRHEVGAHYERQGRLRAQLEPLADIAETRAAVDLLGRDATGPEEALRRKEVAQHVQLTLDGLPPHYGDALEWKYIQGLSVKEIAERLGMGAKAVESLLTRARDAFRDGFAGPGTVVKGWET
jgi:RNA polymerase sigma-70 factor (ECF subfamily)